MPVQLTYPGVYVEEIPSGVRTITGASTSVALFVGYTPHGPLDKPVRVFNFGEYERSFGGLDPASDLSYAVYHYFLNGGSDAYVIRVAAGAATARLSLHSGQVIPIDSPALAALPSLNQLLDVSALRVGAEGNRIAMRVTHVDDQGRNDLFDLVVDPQDGSLPESFRGLSMDSSHPAYAVTAINQRSDLIRVSALGAPLDTAIGATQGRCVGALLPYVELTPLLTSGQRFSLSYNGDAPVEITLPAMTPPAGPPFTTDAERAKGYGDYLAATIEATVRTRGGAYTTFSCRWDEPTTDDYIDPLPDAAAYGRLIALSGVTRASTPGATSSVSFQAVPGSTFATAAKLTRAEGAREYASASFVRPAQNGTETGDLWQAARILAHLGGDVGFDVVATGLPPATSGGPTTSATHFVAFSGAVPGTITSGMTLDALRSQMQTQLRSVGADYLSGATVEVRDGRFLIRPSGSNPNVVLQFSGARVGPVGAALPRAMRALGLGAPPQRTQTARSLLGHGLAIGLQNNPSPGADGTRSTSPTHLLGNENAKTGMYAAADIDAFNLLCFPGETSAALLNPAAAYCERRRAMLIVDPPENFSVASGESLNDAVRHWYTAPGVTAPPRSKNVAVYHPRLMAPDPLAAGVVRAFPPCGAVAGVIARTDGERGIWKAPAGVDATLKGVTGLKYRLTEQEIGVLNQVGLNCLREMPLYGQVVWGARTREGADDTPSEWKYLPVRRLALYVEESLYRGTQWAVFEPNDEPLWAQLRLNVGAFMNSLFRQGAFQGKSAREAYFVKCDGEVNTQADINQGRVNVVVGFAPLKPAEFVVIKLQQIAGQIPT